MLMRVENGGKLFMCYLVARKLSRISCLSSCLQQFPQEGEKWERAGRGREELLFILRRQAATPPSGLPSSQTQTTVALDDYKLSRQHNASEEINISLNTFTKSFINILLEIYLQKTPNTVSILTPDNKKVRVGPSPRRPDG